VIQRSGAFVESAGVPGIWEFELVKIKMMTELVTKGAQERAERSDFLAYSSSHPHADQHRLGSVIPKKLCRPALSNSQRPGCEYANAALRNLVEVCGICQKLHAGIPNATDIVAVHSQCELLCNLLQSWVPRQVNRGKAIAFGK
jgi:hypothetical protein